MKVVQGRMFTALSTQPAVRRSNRTASHVYLRILDGCMEWQSGGGGGEACIVGEGEIENRMRGKEVRWGEHNEKVLAGKSRDEDGDDLG